MHTHVTVNFILCVWLLLLNDVGVGRLFAFRSFSALFRLKLQQCKIDDIMLHLWFVKRTGIRAVSLLFVQCYVYLLSLFTLICYNLLQFTCWFCLFRSLSSLFRPPALIFIGNPPNTGKNIRWCIAKPNNRQKYESTLIFMKFEDIWSGCVSMYKKTWRKNLTPKVLFWRKNLENVVFYLFSLIKSIQVVILVH